MTEPSQILEENLHVVIFQLRLCEFVTNMLLLNQQPRFEGVELDSTMTESKPFSPADSKAIVDGNLKLILGLIWTLILHYSISMPMWDEDEETDDGKQKTPKQRLLGWIQNKLPELPITNFHRDWQTGRALGALVDSCAPGTAPCCSNPEEDLNPAC